MTGLLTAEQIEAQLVVLERERDKIVSAIDELRVTERKMKVSDRADRALIGR